MLTTATKFGLVGFLIVATRLATAGPAEPGADNIEREICGRLVIGIAGAGMDERIVKQKDDPFKLGTFEINSLEHMRQFAARRDSLLPVKMVTIYSAPALIKLTDKLFENSLTHLIGNAPNYIATMADLEKSNHSIINRAFDEFKKTKACTDLMDKSPGADIRDFLVVEIIADSHFAQTSLDGVGIASWSQKSMEGSGADWREDGARAMGAEQFRALNKVLEGSYIQTFFNSCQGGLVGKTYEEAAEDTERSCFLASTNQRQKEVVGGSWRPLLSYAASIDRRTMLSSQDSPWEGAESMYAMAPRLYNKFAVMVFPGEKENPYGLLDAKTPRNPLISFIYSSADRLAEDALQKLAGIPEDITKSPSTMARADVLALSKSADDASKAKGAYYAEATDELPISLGTKSTNADVTRINEAVEGIKRDLDYALTKSESRFELSTFTLPMDSFVNCMKSKTGGGDENCNALNKYIDKTYSAGAAASYKEIAFIAAYDEFSASVKAHDPSATVREYVETTKTLPEVFEGLSDVQQKYWEMKKNLDAVIFADKSIAGREKKTLVAAVDAITGKFETAYSVLRKSSFEQLRSEAILVKLEKITIAANLVASNAGTLPPGYADKYLKQLAGKLKCLTQVPVGPKLDGVDPSKRKSTASVGKSR